MARQVLDTNRLLAFWHGKLPRPGQFGSVRSVNHAVEAAERVYMSYPDAALVTPVRLEFLGGTRDKDELSWADAFLDEFDVIDSGDVIPQDWAEAERLARRVRHGGRSRGAIDCLIVAICNRLHLELYSDDSGLPK